MLTAARIRTKVPETPETGTHTSPHALIPPRTNGRLKGEREPQPVGQTWPGGFHAVRELVTPLTRF